MQIKIFITGGTFDKEYDPISQTLVVKETHVPQMLEVSRSRLETDVEKLMFMDSLNMQKKDREFIAQKCIDAQENHIVITHGTDTMQKTAEVISGVLKEKTVVITGAMIPYSIDGSCSLFNLGSALAFVQTLEPGVYLSMDGRYFRWDNFRKNKETGEFETIE